MPEARSLTVLRLQQRLQSIRAVSYGAVAGVAAVILVSGGGGRQVALIVVSAIAVSIGRLPGTLVRQVERALWTDAAVALALWWLYGPIVGVDFVLFYVVAASSIMLPRRRAIVAIAMATVSELSQFPLHLVAERQPLPLFHPEAQVVGVAEFATGVALRTAAILAMGVLFLTVAAIMRRAEEARDRSEARFRELYERAPLAYLTVEPGGCITSANDAIGALLSRDPADVVGTICAELYAPGAHGRDRARQIFDAARAGDQIRDEELQLDPCYGSDRWIAISADPVTDDDGPPVEIRAALIDVTERRRAERLQAEANAQLKSLVAAKDRFIASVSHEIRTPLAGVLGFTESLRTAWDDFEDEERRDLIGVVSDQSREMSFLVEDLLVAARTELDELTVARSPIDLREEARWVVDLCRHCDADFDGRVELEPAGTTATAVGDGLRTRQILRNLLTNALRHGGPAIRFVLVPDADGAVVEVRDNGDGIPDHLRDSVFEPYAKAGAARGLTESVGLGLTVAASLARLMGGRLTYGRDGEESVFRLELPKSEIDHQAA